MEIEKMETLQELIEQAYMKIVEENTRFASIAREANESIAHLRDLMAPYIVCICGADTHRNKNNMVYGSRMEFIADFFENKEWKLILAHPEEYRIQWTITLFYATSKGWYIPPNPSVFACFGDLLKYKAREIAQARYDIERQWA